VVLASLLYLGAGLALSLVRVVRRPAVEAPLVRSDVPLLLVVIVTGGLLGPILMLLGLQRISGVTGSLLLNLEAPFTMLLAVCFFGEHLGRRELAAAAVIVAGGAMLVDGPVTASGSVAGALLLAGACLSWAVDNNATQRLSIKDPVAIVRIKALGAGLGSLLVALVISAPFPSADVLLPALLLGAVSYGLSIVLDAYALRLVGAAREAAYFATAPFFGALIAVPVLGERLAGAQLAAGMVMVLGVLALLRSRHDHLHRHDPIVHEHVHVHDDHHPHDHAALMATGESHTHAHAHEPIAHDHPHVPDVHHRHRH
jgi:drug/metabolite transporter (DMT)-like permease